MKKFYKRLNNFLSILYFVLTASFKPNKLKSILAASKLALGSTLDVAALLILTKILSNGSITISGGTKYIPYEFDPMTIGILQGMIIVLVLFTISALCGYSANTLVLKLSVDLEKRLTEKYLSYLGGETGLKSLIESKQDFKDLSRVLMSSPRLAGRLLKQLYSLIHPTLKSIALLFALLVLDIKTTMLILTLLIILGYVQYIINRRAANYSRMFDSAQRTSRLIIKDILKESILKAGQSSNRNLSLWSNKDIGQALKAYRMRTQVTEESKLATNISKSMLIMCVFLLSFSFAPAGLSEKEILSSLIHYVPALAFFIISLQSVLAGITNISRFYPQVSNYHQATNNYSSNLLNSLYIPVQHSNNIPLGKPRKIFIISGVKQAFNSHLHLLSILKKKQCSLADKNTVSLTTSTVDSIKEFHKINSIEDNTLSIIYISSRVAKEIKSYCPVYQIDKNQDALVKWKETKNEDLDDLIAADDDDDDF